MSRGRRTTLGAGITAAALVASAGSAVAATTVGSDLARAPDTAICPGTPTVPNSCTEAIAGLSPAADAPGGPTVPADGVVVRWRISRAASAVAPLAQLRLIRGTTGVGRSAAVTLPAAAGVFEFATRLPVVAGDKIGVDVLDLAAGIPIARASVSATDLTEEWDPPLADGLATPPTTTAMSELLLNADVEPDADRDGFGDETQDGCPSDPTTQGPCPVAVAPVAPPDTRLTRTPRKQLRKARATVEFRSEPGGASFECSLDGRAFRSCSSPQKLNRLDRGKHLFLVRALFGSSADPTPAEARFKVKKRKKKRRGRGG